MANVKVSQPAVEAVELSGEEFLALKRFVRLHSEGEHAHDRPGHEEWVAAVRVIEDVCDQVWFAGDSSESDWVW